MTEIVIEKKKYVLLTQEDYNLLQRKAASAVGSEMALSLDEAKQRTKSQIRKWAGMHG